jgi:hypothetical protein
MSPEEEQHAELMRLHIAVRGFQPRLHEDADGKTIGVEAVGLEGRDVFGQTFKVDIENGDELLAWTLLHQQVINGTGGMNPQGTYDAIR